MAPGLDTSFLGKEQRKTVALAIFCGVCAFGGWLVHDVFGAKANASQEKRLERIERMVNHGMSDLRERMRGVETKLGIPARPIVHLEVDESQHE